MKRQVLVIGRKSPPDGEIEAFLPALRPGSYVRCDTGMLLETVRQQTKKLDGKIDVLDLLDHGHEGSQSMGNAELFQVDQAQTRLDQMLGHRAAGELTEYLSERAHVRLFGCTTGCLEVGRTLLLDLQEALGPDRMVYAAIEHILPSNFGPDGFNDGWACQFLYSAHEAKRAVAPDSDTRTTECNARIKREGVSPPVALGETPRDHLARLRTSGKSCPTCGRPIKGP